MPGAYNRSLNSVKLKIGNEVYAVPSRSSLLWQTQHPNDFLYHVDHFSCYYFDQILYGCMEVDFTFYIHISLQYHRWDVWQNTTASTISFLEPQISTSVPWLFLNTIGGWVFQSECTVSWVRVVEASSQSMRNHFVQWLVSQMTFGQCISWWNNSFGLACIT